MPRRFACPALLLGATIFAAAAFAPPARAQDVAVGKATFRQICSACHAVTPARTLVGPTLFKVVGRSSGSEPGYQYSDGNKRANLVWDAPTLDRYLAAPREVVPGTKMVYAGLKDPQMRKDLIAYLTTLR